MNFGWKNMGAYGIKKCQGKVLQGLMRKIDRSVEARVNTWGNRIENFSNSCFIGRKIHHEGISYT